jgi:hypothetical protein
MCNMFRHASFNETDDITAGQNFVVINNMDLDLGLFHLERL